MVEIMLNTNQIVIKNLYKRHLVRYIQTANLCLRSHIKNYAYERDMKSLIAVTKYYKKCLIKWGVLK